MQPIHDHCLQAVALGLQVVAPELEGLKRPTNQGARPIFFQIIERAPFIRAQRIWERMTKTSLSPFPAAVLSCLNTRLFTSAIFSGVTVTGCNNDLMRSSRALSARPEPASFDALAVAVSTM
jgi:hypothetical protein